MCSVNISICHDDDLVVSQFVDIELFADIAAERGDHVLDLIRTQYSVEPCFLYIEDLAAKRKDGLSLAVSSLLSGAACAVALYEEDL